MLHKTVKSYEEYKKLKYMAMLVNMFINFMSSNISVSRLNKNRNNLFSKIRYIICY